MTGIKTTEIGTEWIGAVQPVAPVTDAGRAGEHPASRDQQQATPGTKPATPAESEAPAAKIPGVLYTKNGDVIPAELPKPLLDLKG